jgi:hypothetical protein
MGHGATQPMNSSAPASEGGAQAQRVQQHAFKIIGIYFIINIYCFIHRKIRLKAIMIRVCHTKKARVLERIAHKLLCSSLLLLDCFLSSSLLTLFLVAFNLVHISSFLLVSYNATFILPKITKTNAV